MAMCFDIFSYFEGEEAEKIGDRVSSEVPTITFDGGNVGEGWLHEVFSFTGGGWTFEAWDSYGYRTYNREERLSSTDEILTRIRAGELPLSGWSNREGFDLLNRLVNGVPVDELKARIRQVRDALNKCRDLWRIEAAARVLGV